jgi:SpoIID/LytB domain protein
MFATSPPAALQAQAVAARNQLFAKLGKRHHDDPFHLCAEQHCQVYSGTAKEHPASTAAVRATAGQVLFLGEQLVDTVYSSTCGGHTEDNDAVWGNVANPALRGRPDFVPSHGGPRFDNGVPPDQLRPWLEGRPATFCSQNRKARPEKFRWRVTLSAADLRQRLAPHYPDLGPLQRIDVEERGRGGRIISLALIGENTSATVVHELPIRRLFGNLNSAAFVLDHHRNGHGQLLSVTFTGGGWGHGVGMCQLGAIGRAEAGHDYKQILGHYYNGATPVVLY